MDKAMITRVVIAVFSIINTVLTSFGYPIIGDEVINAVVIIAGAIVTGYAIWKDNNITKKARDKKKLL